MEPGHHESEQNMKDVANEQYWAEMIAKYLSGNCDDTEVRELERWKQESAANMEYYTGMEKVWNMSDATNIASPDVDQWWEKTRSSLALETGARVIGMRSLYRYVSAAAVVLVLIAAGIWFSRGDMGQSQGPVFYSAAADTLRQMTELPDGSKVWLRGGSSIEFNEDFEPREVALSGEAFFEVESDPDNPFTVLAGGSAARVLGTKFNIATRESGEVELVVTEGRVAFGEETRETAELEVFTADEGAVFVRETQVVQRLQSIPVNLRSWQSGKLVFRNTPLRSALIDLENYYGKHYSITDSALWDVDLNAEFDNQTHDTVVNAIEFMLNVKFREDGDTIRISRGTKEGGIE